jgi:hypothetical protein
MLQLLFGRYLAEVRYLFAASSSCLRDEIRLPLLSLIERPEFASDKILKLCRQYLLGELPRSCDLKFFKLFGPFLRDLDADVQHQLTEIQVLLNVASVDKSTKLLEIAREREWLRLKNLHHLRSFHTLQHFRNSTRLLRCPISPTKREVWTAGRDSDELLLATPKPHVSRLVLLFSAECEIVGLSSRTPATFSVLLAEIRISPIITIPFNAISIVLAVRDQCIEIFTNSCQSFLLHFFEGEIGDLIEALPFPVLSDSNSSSLIGLWQSGEVANFDLILGLNLLSGRSFNDPFRYPIFPVVYAGLFLSDARSVSPKLLASAVPRWLAEGGASNFKELVVGAAAEIGVIIPEFYFRFVDSHKVDIYEGRKALDCCFDGLFHEWIRSTFQVDLPALEKVSKIEKFASCKITSRQILIAQFLDDDHFFVIYEDSTLCVFGLGAQSVAKLQSFGRQLTLNKGGFFIGLEAMILIVGSHTAYRISDKSEMVYHSAAITHMAPMGNSVVYVLDSSLIVVSAGRDFPFRRTTLVAEAEKVVLIETNSAFRVVVYTTASQKMLIVSMGDSVLLGTCTFEDETIEKVLVTNCWGFVICKTERQIVCFSLNGLLLQRADFEKGVLFWAATSVDGVDFVIGLDTEMNWFSFEAFYPGKVRWPRKESREILAMRPVRDSIVLITKDGNASLVPLGLLLPVS